MAFGADKSLTHTVRIWLTDPFSTVHHSFNWFDSLLLFPYFLVMIVLALYGIHRYTMCYNYFKFRKRHNPEPPSPLRSSFPGSPSSSPSSMSSS